MSDFDRFVSYWATAKCDGRPRLLTAKIVCNRIVFAGGEFGAISIEADASLEDANQMWRNYCMQNDAAWHAHPEQIDQGDLDRARGLADGREKK